MKTTTKTFSETDILKEGVIAIKDNKQNLPGLYQIETELLKLLVGEFTK